MKRLQHRLEYLCLRLVESLLALLPRFVSLRIGALGGAVLYHTGFGRAVVAKNLRYVALWDEEQIRRITRRLYRTIGRYAVDFLRPCAKLPPYRMENVELIDEYFARGKGIIAVLAHFGNWELLAALFGRGISDLNVIAKPMRNPIVEEWLAGKRRRTGVATINFSHAMRRSLHVLRRNGMLAVLIDQYAGSEGTTVPFLGKEANTLRAVAGLVHRTECAVLPVSAIMEDDGRYRVVLERVEQQSPAGRSAAEFIPDAQRRHNDVVSHWVRENPDHYFGWFHRRFRGGAGY